MKWTLIPSSSSCWCGFWRSPEVQSASMLHPLAPHHRFNCATAQFGSLMTHVVVFVISWVKKWCFRDVQLWLSMTQTCTQLVHNKLAGVGRKWNLSLAAGFREFSPGKAIYFQFTTLNYWHLISVLNCAAGVPVSSFSISAYLCPFFLWDSRTALLVLYSPLALMISSAELNYYLPV